MQNTSLAVLIENYLKRITNEQQETEAITPLVKSLSGILDLPKGSNPKKGYTEYLIAKYK
jgi:Family of unknown function (DUF6364)